MSPTPGATNAPADDDRAVLNGWKEIAAYFRKGVRTVQRWEAEMAMPVHRLAGRRGEVVYAVPRELDEWRRRQERGALAGQPGEEDGVAGSGRSDAAGNGRGDLRAEPYAPPAGTTSGNGNHGGGREAAGSLEPGERAGPGAETGRPDAAPAERGGAAATAGTGRGIVGRRAAGGLAAAVLVIAALAAIGLWWKPWAGGRPVGVRVHGDQLIAIDATGQEVWSATLPYAAQDIYRQELGGPKRLFTVEDVDGDGTREVVLLAFTRSSDGGEVFCFDEDGRLRWRRSGTRSATFGHGRMAAPWVPMFFAVLKGSAGASSLWVSWANQPDFGAFVERLDPVTGEARAVYWSAGYVTALASGTLASRPVVFLGAANNEHRSASLAVYDLSLAAGGPPSVDPRYTCFDCPAGRPARFFVFPKTSVGRELNAETQALAVDAITQDASGAVKAVVTQNGADPRYSATVMYRFDAALRLTGAEFIDDYRMTHRQLEREGRLPGPMGPEEAAELFPVLSWEDGRFVEIAAPRR